MLKGALRKAVMPAKKNDESGQCLSCYRLHLNCKLHGSFLVFSREYFSVFKGFDARTFLYMEEDILFVHLMRHELSTLYYPGIAVFHKEDVSTEQSVGTGRKKQRFIYSEHIKSIQAYIDVLEEYENRVKLQ